MPNIDCSILDAIAIQELWKPWFKDPATWARMLDPAGYLSKRG